MHHQYRICIFITLCTFITASKNVEKAFMDNKIVPDILQKAPPELCKVVYPSGAIPNLGNTLSTDKTWEEPKVEWNYDSNTYYTLAMIDPDGPTPQDPKWREIQHLVVGNILGNNVTQGEYITTYLRPRPPPGSDPHRYIYLVFKQQQGPQSFDEKRILERSPERFNFSISKFMKKYNLGDALFGNFFYAKHEDK